MKRKQLDLIGYVPHSKRKLDFGEACKTGFGTTEQDPKQARRFLGKNIKPSEKLTPLYRRLRSKVGPGSRSVKV